MYYRINQTPINAPSWVGKQANVSMCRLKSKSCGLSFGTGRYPLPLFFEELACERFRRLKAKQVKARYIRNNSKRSKREEKTGKNSICLFEERIGRWFEESSRRREARRSRESSSERWILLPTKLEEKRKRDKTESRKRFDDVVWIHWLDEIFMNLQL